MELFSWRRYYVGAHATKSLAVEHTSLSEQETYFKQRYAYYYKIFILHEVDYQAFNLLVTASHNFVRSSLADTFVFYYTLKQSTTIGKSGLQHSIKVLYFSKALLIYTNICLWDLLEGLIFKASSDGLCKMQ